jgi:hypothetical protein
MSFLAATEGGELGHRLLIFVLNKISSQERRARRKWGASRKLRGLEKHKANLCGPSQNPGPEPDWKKETSSDCVGA